MWAVVVEHGGGRMQFADQLVVISDLGVIISSGCRAHNLSHWRDEESD